MNSAKPSVGEEARPPFIDLESGVNWCLERLRLEFITPSSEQSFDSFAAAAIRWVETNDPNDKNPDFAAYLAQSSDSLFYPLQNALRLLFRAKRANVQGEIDEAWGLLLEGVYSAGYACGEIPWRHDAENNNFRDVARRGGVTKAANAAARYKAAAAIIEELAPPNGWANPKAAINAVKDAVFSRLRNPEFNYEVKPQMQTVRLQQWYNRHEIIKQAICKHLRGR